MFLLSLVFGSLVGFALGLTGGGGGGSMIALCPDSQDQVAAAMEAAGYKTLQVMPG